MMVEKQRWVLSFDYDERVKSSRRSRAGVKCRCASAGAFFSYGQEIPANTLSIVYRIYGECT